MYTYDTVSEALAGLKDRGYKYDFNLRHNNLFCNELNKEYSAPELIVKETYRFEGASDPEDEAVVYAIETNDGAKGSFVNAYGTYADTESEALLQHLTRSAVTTNK